MSEAKPVQPWMLEAAHAIIHGKHPHARPSHLPEQACEWAAMSIAEAFDRELSAVEPGGVRISREVLERVEGALSIAYVALRDLGACRSRDCDEPNCSRSVVVVEEALSELRSASEGRSR